MEKDEDCSIVASSDFSMVKADFVGECLRLPPSHARCRYRYPIDSASLDRLIATDFFEAGGPK